MTVALHPSETRAAEERAPAAAGRKIGLFVLGGIAGLGLLAFSVGAFSFFSDLADPRARAARNGAVAASWPDLKDGVPALAAKDGAAKDQPAVSLPSPDSIRAEAPKPVPEAPKPVAEAPKPPVEAAKPVAEAPKAEASKPAAPAKLAAEKPRPAAPAARPPLPIANAAMVGAGEAAAPAVTPARTAKLIAPAKSETVKAKDERPSTFVSLPSAEKPAAATPAPKKAAAAQPAPPAKKPATKAVAAAQAPGEAASPAPAAPDEPELLGVKIPGARALSDGVKAVGNLFGGQSDEN
ncbi:hypothetical protein MMB17_02290 [Methylobacterium organophilum]|uniref:hypothetical protein n=1 Tax=Methylobacterium organophilum TaxID=410 RepID=UPI001F138C45|nr:hypothetical protein [Methylobacterium organophilum]UMY18203.1 hypothetical protein MMB17_02290 [Methylobacterium organophilum]